MSYPTAKHSTPTVTVTAEELQARISALPRIEVAYKNTPLERCPRLERALGTTAAIFVKRDDMTGVAFGGNKLRNLEFRLAEAIERQADTLILGVDVLSNSARQTAGAASRLGLKLVLVLIGAPPAPPYQGNLLIDQILGAEIHFVPDRTAQQEKMKELEQQYTQAERRPYVMTFSPLFQQASALAYAECTLEIIAQLANTGRTLDWLYMTSSGKGIAGPLLAVKALGLATRVVSVSPMNTQGRAPEIAAQVANETAALLDLNIEFAPTDFMHHDRYGDPGYGVVTSAGVEAMRLIGTTEGILADSVYTGKAFAGMFADIRSGQIGGDETVVFVHTGGLPLIFNRAAEITELLASTQAGTRTL